MYQPLLLCCPVLLVVPLWLRRSLGVEEEEGLQEGTTRQSFLCYDTPQPAARSDPSCLPTSKKLITGGTNSSTYRNIGKLAVKYLQP